MNSNQMKKKYSKLSTDSIFDKLLSENISKKESTIFYQILDQRFPTPLHHEFGITKEMGDMILAQFAEKINQGKTSVQDRIALDIFRDRISLLAA